MGTNLTIQNSIVRPSTQQVQTKKPAPDFDIQRELNNRTFIKPLKGKGKLVNETIFNYPNLMVKGIKYKIINKNTNKRQVSLKILLLIKKLLK